LDILTFISYLENGRGFDESKTEIYTWKWWETIAFFPLWFRCSERVCHLAVFDLFCLKTLWWKLSETFSQFGICFRQP